MKKLFSFVLASLCSLCMLAQSTVTGTVTGSDDGKPISFANVQLKGSTAGVFTDDNGKYSIEVPAGGTLVFSYMGYITQEIAVGNKAVMNVALDPDAIVLDETIVVAYGTAKKEAFTGSASTVKGDRIAKEAASALSPERALSGYVAGVRVSNDNGQPGSSPQVQIRGIGSITQSTTPLYVLDGIPMNSDQLNSINPNDIESMTVLKDAAATSLYGSRASSGVIMITTKKGALGKTVFDVSYEHAVSTESVKNQLNGYYMDGAELTNYTMEGLKNYYLYSQEALPGMAKESQYQSLTNAANDYALGRLYSSGRLVHPDDQLDGTFDYNNLSRDQLMKYLTNPRNTDWYKAMFQNGSEDKVNVSAKGGNEKTSFYASLGYVKQSGITLGSDFERFSGRVSVENKATDFLRFNYIQSIAWTQQENKLDSQGAVAGNPVSNLRGMNPTLPAYNADGTPYKHPGFDVTTPNFLETIMLDRNKYTRFSSITNFNFTVDFTKWLKFTSTNGFDLRYYKNSEIWSPESSQGEATNGQINEQRQLALNLVTSNILNFNKEFGDHSISALAGYEAKWYKSDFLEGTATNFPVSRLMYLSNASVPTLVAGDPSNDKLVSWISKADYNYKNKYFLSGSFRSDGTSRLLKENRWGNFWSVSGAWTISRENFMESTRNWLDNLRLKVSYGTNGTQPTSYFSSLTLFGIDSKYNGQPAVYPSAVGNPNITWETSYTWNAGVDFSIFNGRLRGVIEYYNKLTKDLINSRSVSYTYGWSSVLENNGKLRNTGLEVTLDSRNIVNKEFTWETSLNLSYMKANVEELSTEKISDPYIYREGYPLYSFYLREFAGVDPATGRSQWYKNTMAADGVTVVDHNSLTQDVTEAQKVIYKKGYPDVYGGLSNRFTYKGFDLSFLITFSFGGYIYDTQYTASVTDGASIGNRNMRYDSYKNAWKQPGDNAKTPIIIYSDPYNSNYTSTRVLVPSDHAKIKNISLGYSLPQNWVNKIKMSNIRLYFTANDIYTFYKYKYLNPEVGVDGYYNQYSYPALRSWRFGINFQF